MKSKVFMAVGLIFMATGLQASEKGQIEMLFETQVAIKGLSLLLEQKLGGLIDQLNRLEGKIDSIDARMDTLEGKVSGLETEVSDVHGLVEAGAVANLKIHHGGSGLAQTVYCRKLVHQAQDDLSNAGNVASRLPGDVLGK